MFLRKVGFLIVLYLLVSAGFAAEIKCPPVYRIRIAAGDNISVSYKDPNTQLYRAYTYQPAFKESELTWFVGVDRILANSEKQAVEIGKLEGQKAQFKRTEFAFPQDDVFVCLYGPGETFAWGKKYS